MIKLLPRRLPLSLLQHVERALVVVLQQPQPQQKQTLLLQSARTVTTCSSQSSSYSLHQIRLQQHQRPHSTATTTTPTMSGRGFPHGQQATTILCRKYYPCRRQVWNASFMDAQAASQIATEIRQLALEQTLRETHPQLSPMTSTMRAQNETLQTSLKHKYFLLTGEVYEDDNEDYSSSSGYTSDGSSGSGTHYNCNWSNVHVLEVELRLLEQELQTVSASIGSASTDDATSPDNLSHGIQKERIKALQATMEALQEEVQTMKRSHNGNSSSNTSMDLD